MIPCSNKANFVTLSGHSQANQWIQFHCVGIPDVFWVCLGLAQLWPNAAPMMKQYLKKLARHSASVGPCFRDCWCSSVTLNISHYDCHSSISHSYHSHGPMPPRLWNSVWDVGPQLKQCWTNVCCGTWWAFEIRLRVNVTVWLIAIH